MSHTPPVPEDNQSPYPLQEPPHPHADGLLPASEDSVRAAPESTVEQRIAEATAAVGPLADKAVKFAQARPWATAALLGTLALGLIGTLRGKRA